MSTNLTNLNGTQSVDFTKLTWSKIFVATLLYIITLVTIIGNILVLVAFKVNKKLQTTFNYYIVNLAITDIAVAVTAMSFQATHIILGYWPFGEVICALWIFFDYGMTFISVFTLLLISADRFWSVQWSIHYRNHHTKKKCRMAILLAWISMLVLWVPPWLLDRIRHSRPGECYWDPSLNMEFVYIVAILGHHCPYLVIMTCYILIFVLIRKRAKIEPLSNGGTRFSDKHLSSSSGEPLPSESSRHVTRVNPVKPDVQSSGISKNLAVVDFQNSSDTYKRQPRLDQIPEVQLGRRDKDKRVFIALSYIIVAYGVLWLPFHVVFDISIVNPSLVPEQVLNLAFWMAYCNSTINPLLYNISNVEFRKTFKRLLCGCIMSR